MQSGHLLSLVRVLQSGHLLSLVRVVQSGWAVEFGAEWVGTY